MVVWGTVVLGFQFSRILSSLGLEWIESKCSTRPVLCGFVSYETNKNQPYEALVLHLVCGLMSGTDICMRRPNGGMRAGMTPVNSSQGMTCFFSWPFDWGCRQLFWRNFCSVLSLDRMPQDKDRMDVNNPGGAHLFCNCVPFSSTVCKFGVSLHIIVQVFYT